MPIARRLAVLLLFSACRTAAPSPRAELTHPGDPFWSVAAPDSFRAIVQTTQGQFVMTLYRAWAPRGVDHFYNLARAGFYDDSRFFRTVPNFIAQFGIAGRPEIETIWRDRTIPDDPEGQKNMRGTFAFSMKGPNDRRTQIYINLVDNTRNDGQGFAILGRVAEGMDIVDRLYNGYGETSGGGMRAGHQDSLLIRGNSYLDRAFPRLDRLIRITVAPVPGH